VVLVLTTEFCFQFHREGQLRYDAELRSSRGIRRDSFGILPVRMTSTQTDTVLNMIVLEVCAVYSYTT
jgi:hypothetical protein